MSWLRELQWMPGLGPVPLVELAPDFEAHPGRAMPASPGAELQAVALYLPERARVLGTALSVFNTPVASGALVQGTVTLQARALVPPRGWPLRGAHAQTVLHQEVCHDGSTAGAGWLLRRVVGCQDRSRARVPHSDWDPGTTGA